MSNSCLCFAYDCFRYILVGLNSNKFVKHVKLNLSGNNFGANGCQVLESFMVENQTIETLDISDNGMYCCCGDYEIE